MKPSANRAALLGLALTLWAVAVTSTQGAPPGPTKSPSELNVKATRDIELGKVFKRVPLAKVVEATEPKVGKPQVSLQTTDALAFVESARRVQQTRKIEEAMAFVNIPRLALARPVDANLFTKTLRADELPNISGYFKKQKFYFDQNWPKAGAEKQVRVDREVDPTPEGMWNFINDVLAERLSQGPLYPPLQETDFRFEMAASYEELATKLGFSIEATGFGAKLGVSYAREETVKSRRKIVYAYLRQKFFTVSLGGHRHHGNLFADELPADALGELLGESRLGIVDSVCFGRVAFISIQSTEDSAKVFESLKFRFSNAWAKASAGYKKDHLKILNTVQMRYVLSGGTIPRGEEGRGGDPKVFTSGVDEAAEAILKFFNATLSLSEENLPVPIGFTVSDVATGKSLGKNEVTHFSLFQDLEAKPYQYRLSYVKARIKDQADSGFAGPGDWLVKVVANGESGNDSLVINDYREMEHGPQKEGASEYREYDIGVSRGSLPSRRRLKLEFYVGEEDSADLIKAPPEDMKKAWERDPCGAIDDFKYRVFDYDLAKEVTKAYKSEDGTVVHDIKITTDRGNEFYFRLEIIAPEKPRGDDAPEGGK